MLSYLIKTTRSVLGRVGVNVREVEGCSYCPDPVSVRAYNHDVALALSARNMALAGRCMLVACSGFNTLV